MSDIKVQDNFLSSDELKQVQDLIGPTNPNNEVQKRFGMTPWCLGQTDYRNDDYYQLSSMHYHAPSPVTGVDPIVSSGNHIIFPFFLTKINIKCLLRIKSNLLMRTSNIVKHHFHQDYPDDFKGVTTSIFYLDSNNGYTEFKDGTIIRSVSNRFISFPSYMKHRGTTCTDKPFRIVINFNYF